MSKRAAEIELSFSTHGSHVKRLLLVETHGKYTRAPLLSLPLNAIFQIQNLESKTNGAQAKRTNDQQKH